MKIDTASRRLLLGVLLFVLLSFVGGLAAATQSVARAYHYHRGLGFPLLRWSGVPLYLPWKVLEWRAAFGELAPAEFARAQGVGLCVFFAPLVLIVVVTGGGVYRLRARPRTGSVTHGSARWATTKELEQAHLLDDAGIVLCQTSEARLEVLARGGFRLRRQGRLVRDGEGGLHTVIFAPSGSGKGVSVVCPSLLSFTGSVIAWDIKRELWDLTAGWRSTFSHCWRFEPASVGSARYNPLAEIRLGANEVRDAQAIAEMLVDPEGKGEGGESGGNERHFRFTAQSLLVGVILHILYAEKDKTLRGVARFLSDPQRGQFDTLTYMMMTKHVRGAPHPVVAGAAREMLNKTEVELSGVFSTAMAALGLYRDPLVAEATDGSDFRIADLMRGRHPQSLYLVVAPSDLARLRPLMRLVLNQIGRRLTEDTAKGTEDASKHRLLMMLDEFPTLGKMQFFAEAISYLRGYGIKLVLICQSLNQLEEKYGEKNSIIDNCAVRLTFRANDERTAERVSKLLGQSTYQTTNESVSAEVGSLFGKRQKSSGVQEHARALLTPGEILQLPQDEALLFATGCYPYRGKKVVYYEDDRFKARAALLAPEATRGAHGSPRVTRLHASGAGSEGRRA